MREKNLNSIVKEKKKAISTEPYSPDREKLERPFEDPRNKTQLFCRRCGSYYEVGLREAQKIAKENKIELSGKKIFQCFFSVPCCEEDGCAGIEGKVFLTKIKSLPKPIKPA